MAKEIGYVQKKILLALAGGLVLGLSRSPKQYFRVAKQLQHAWSDLSSRQLHDATYSLYEAGFLDEIEHADGSVTMVLSEKGRKTTVRYDPEQIVIHPPEKWDRKWRMVLFDIPEKRKNARDALRETMHAIGFLEYQKSVFVFPHDCRKEIKFLVEHFGLKPYVRFMIVESMDNELSLRKIFKIA